MNFRSTILLTALVISFVIRNAEGQVPGNHFAWGNSNAVTDHAAQMMDQLWLAIYQPQTNGSVIWFAKAQYSGYFTNMNELNSFMRSNTGGFATNVLRATNIDFGAQFVAYFSANDMADGFYTTAYCYYPFYLVKNGTNYSLPDFSSMTMSLESDMATCRIA